MVLVRATSRGTLALDLDSMGKWMGVTVGVFALGEDGWSEHLGAWGSYRDRQGSLSGFLVEEIGLPSDEAEQLAEEALSGFRERGGERGLSRWQWVEAAGFSALATSVAFLLPAVLVVGLLVWLGLTIF